MDQSKFEYKINFERLQKFRQNMHQYPETGFQEFKTQQNIIQFLENNLKIPKSEIKPSAKTGVTLDLQGKAPSQGQNLTIALRADIDALPMTEENDDLSYKSQTKADHACGHDGHTATMLGFIEILVQALDKIPSNKKIRILFQPSEEGPASGAKMMVEEGILNNVDEIYGYHNWPMHPVGYLLAQDGPMMASQTVIKIKIIGKGGHGSQPENCNDPLQIGLAFYDKFKNLIENILKGRKFVCTLPVFNCGTNDSVIAETAIIEGTLRSLEKNLPNEFEQHLHQILKETIEMTEFKGAKYEMEYIRTFEQVTNTKTETDHVLKIGQKMFDQDKIGHFDLLPVMASEDFSFYLEKVPGCFFFLGSGRKMNDTMLHNANYNFNDDLLIPGANFFWELVKYRFQI